MIGSGDPTAVAQSRRMLSGFHEAWLALDAYDQIKKDAKAFPEFKETLLPVLKAEARQFTEAVLLDKKLGWSGLMTSTTTFVDRTLAGLYGLKGTFSSSGLTAAELPAGERAGLLTRIGFLAANAHGDETSPVFRGAYVRKHVLCDAPPPPPPGIDLTPPPLSGNIKTRRQQVEAQTTSAEPCRSCHNGLNDFGYALETYDAGGKYRTLDHGQPLDTKVTLRLDGKEVTLDGPIELSRALAASQQARACYASTWLRYLYGRQVGAGDQEVVAKLAAGFGGTGYQIGDMLADVVKSKAFNFRAPDAP
jgi:hypothetical protein